MQGVEATAGCTVGLGGCAGGVHWEAAGVRGLLTHAATMTRML